ncbi:hypothetical protein [Xanthomonas theicola]|uniref:hypothetical protein n=1 Tax=Xanthomonas theicola TaxID=56464 RepID=UPI000FF87610|nr:hypothetical protein [Xanthomonas theicola]QNH26124.1 hypothetical protein G4Q83_17155 [Xanthomonas theicola]
MFVLKKAVKGKRVALEYATKANGDRIAGPGPDERLLFVKSLDSSSQCNTSQSAGGCAGQTVQSSAC